MGNSSSELVITKSRPNSFSFHLDAAAGIRSRPSPQAGELEGKAIVGSSNTAHYKGSAQSDTNDCTLTFRRMLNRLNIEQQGTGTDCGGGDIVSYDGSYVLADQDPNEASDLLLVGALDTTVQDDVLRKLVGTDYETMLATAEKWDEVPNLDGNGATVVAMYSSSDVCSGWVLMYDTKAHQWVGLWQSVSTPGDPQQVIELRYYTSVMSDKKTLPKTISGRDCGQETARVRMMP